MADTVWGVKVTEELKEEIQELVTESGLQNKDFLKQVINIYKIEKQKDKMPAIKEDFNALQELTRKINDLYIALANRVEIHTGSMQDEFEKELNSKQEQIDKLASKEGSLKEELEAIKKVLDEKVNFINSLKEEVNRVNKKNQSQEETIDLLKETLQSAKDQVKIYISHEAAYQQAISDIDITAQELKQSNSQIQQLTSELTDLKTSTNTKIEEIEKQVEIEKRRLDLAKQEELLKLKKQHQEELDNQSKKYRENIDELNQTIKKNMEEFQIYINRNSQQKDLSQDL